MLTPLLIVWAGVTVVLILLLIYRGTLTMHEDDQIFLDEAENHLAKEQEELIRKVGRLQPWVRICGASSALLILVIAGMELYTHMTR